MREFVFGTDGQYTSLKQTLEDRLCHVYNNCAFPGSFSRASGRLGFEKEEDDYALFIDKGITCSRSDASELLVEWLEYGTLRFIDFSDMKEFIRSLNNLY